MEQNKNPEKRGQGLDKEPRKDARDEGRSGSDKRQQPPRQQ
jgi:hypothetical protein